MISIVMYKFIDDGSLGRELKKPLIRLNSRHPRSADLFFNMKFRNLSLNIWSDISSRLLEWILYNLFSFKSKKYHIK